MTENDKRGGGGGVNIFYHTITMSIMYILLAIITGDGRILFQKAIVTGDGRNLFQKAIVTGDGRNLFQKAIVTGEIDQTYNYNYSFEKRYWIK